MPEVTDKNNAKNTEGNEVADNNGAEQKKEENQESDDESTAQTNEVKLSEEELKVAKIEDVILIDPECYELDLNHGRIGKIEKLDELVNIERFECCVVY